MKLTGKSTLKIQVDPDRFRTESLRRSDRGFAYLFDRLCSGQEVAVEELLSWGIKIELAPDLRDVTEDDVKTALADSYVADVLEGVERAALLELYQRMLDAKIGTPDD